MHAIGRCRQCACSLQCSASARHWLTDQLAHCTQHPLQQQCTRPAFTTARLIALWSVSSPFPFLSFIPNRVPFCFPSTRQTASCPAPVDKADWEASQQPKRPDWTSNSDRETPPNTTRRPRVPATTVAINRPRQSRQSVNHSSRSEPKPSRFDLTVRLL